MDTQSKAIVSKYKAVFTAPPEHIPNDTSVDAPLLGNGDMAVAIGGPPQGQQFWLAKNDFWRLKSQYGTSGPRVFGNVQVDIPELEGAPYRIEQNLYEAVTTATFTRDDLTVTMRSWVAATSNLLVIELTASGEPVSVRTALSVAQGNGSETEEGDAGGVWWVTRKFVRDVDIPTEASCALTPIGANALDFSLVPGKPITLAAAMQSRFKSPTYAKDVRETAAQLDPQALAGLWHDHTAWWADFWAKSFVDIDEPDIERHYYISNYVMASCSRDHKFPPPIFGTWITTDTPAWEGDYHLNYNHMAPFYGLYSSNHIEQADPYHAPILDFMERAQWYAREAHGRPGVSYPVGIGPLGIETTRNSPHEKHNEKGGLFYGQKSNAAYAVVPIAMRWRHTYERSYAEALYPFVREVADFWEDYLTFEDGRYVIYGDSVHEGSGTDFNSVVTLGLVRNVFATALDMSETLGQDPGRHEKWRHILAHLSAFATQEKNGKTVFRYTERGTPWWRDNTLGIQHIYPAGAIGLESAPGLLDIAKNTIDVMNRWHDFNGMNSFFPAAVRVGYDAETVLEKIRVYVRDDANPNGFAKDNPHGIENCSTVPNTVNMMLCSGHQGVLRVFPVWPKDKDARFGQIRAQGAFLVSSAQEKGQVLYILIRSEQGRDCTLANPWPTTPVTLVRNGAPAETLTGERVEFGTKAGEDILLRPQG